MTDKACRRVTYSTISGLARKIQKTMFRCQDMPAFYGGDTTGDTIEGKQAGAVTVAVTWGWYCMKKLTQGTRYHMEHALAELEDLLSF
jgi:phosphoglycolate phosphatase